MDEQDYCIVNIWTSDKNRVIEGEDVGHVSLETNLGYYSLWPSPRTIEERAEFRRAYDLATPKEQREMTGKKARFFQTRKEYAMASYEDDLAAKGDHDPEVRLAFYSLKTGEINQYFETVLWPSIQKAGGWRLIGSNVLSRIGNSAENCASLVYRLLLAGGLRSLVKPLEMSTIGSQNSSAVQPDKFLEQMILAKSNELLLKPMTKNLFFNGQSDVAALVEQYKLAGKSGKPTRNDDSSSSFYRSK